MLKGKFSSRRRVTEEVDAMSGLANLSDVMLVFACGLMAAVILNWNVDLSKTRVEILQREQMKELDNAEELEQDIQSSSSFEQKGTVYEDPETGKLYVVMPKSSKQRAYIHQKRHWQPGSKFLLNHAGANRQYNYLDMSDFLLTILNILESLEILSKLHHQYLLIQTLLHIFQHSTPI